MSLSIVPTLTHYDPIGGGDEDDAVQNIKPEDMDDVSKTLDTDKTNPSGSVVKITDQGDAVYNDSMLQIVFSKEGDRITVLDRAARNSQALKVNFTIEIQDGKAVMTYHNPAYKEGGSEPEYLSVEIPKEGMELNLTGGTTLFIEPKADGTFDAHVTNTLGLQTGADVDPTPGYLANFRGLGSGQVREKGFQKNVSVDGAVGGGNEFKGDWELNHPMIKGKQGDIHRVWVTSMFSNSVYDGDGRDLSAKEHPDDNPGAGPGGISVRSDKRYDVNKGCGETLRYIWNDLPAGTPAEVEEFQSSIFGVIYDGKVPVGIKSDNPQDSVDLLEQAQAGAQAFDNPDDPDTKGTSLFGSGAVGSTSSPSDGGGDDLEETDNDRETSSSNSYGSSTLSFADFLADQLDDERRRRSA